ncbi:MAG: tetratricopeptide repeat protein [Dehalococcoidia bacterium]
MTRLHQAMGNGVTLVEAPAGFGKTTLLAQFAAEVDYRTVWLTLDPSSGAPEILAHQLGVALSGNTETDPPATALKPSDLQAYLGAEFAAAVSASQLPLLVVLDNIHELSEARESTHLLSWLIACLPEGSEVILAGRERPFLPEVAGRIATGEVTFIDSAELAFTLDEVRAATEQQSDAPDPREVFEATDGWPVGVMAALASPPSCETTSRLAFDQYLRREVWAPVPESLKETFRRLSLQPSVTRSAVEDAFGRPAWREVTSWLDAHEFLCERLSPVEFRLNPLLRQHIATEFDELDPDGYSEACQAAIDEMVAQGDIPGAIEFARSGGSETQLVRLLEEFSPRLVVQGCHTLLQRSFDCIGEPTLRRNPLLRGIAARLAAHVGDPEEATKKATSLLRDARASKVAQGHALLARIRALRLLGRTDDARTTALQLAELAPDLDENLRAEANYNLAEYELSVSRDFVKAEQLLRAVIADCELREVEPLGLLARSTLGQALAMRGDAPEAVTVLTKAARGWRSMGRSSNLGWVLNNLGMAHVQAGDFASAATVLQEAVDEGENCANQRNVAYATASLGDAELALGHFEVARMHYEDAIRICATDALDESLAALSIAGLSGALLGCGDISQADFFSRRALLVAVSSANSYEIAICKLQQAAVDFASGNHVASIAAATDAAERFTQMEVLPMVGAAYYRVAMAQFKAGQKTDAERTLTKVASALSEPWMVGSLVPIVREDPMFAQWAATRQSAAVAFREVLQRHSFETISAETATLAPAPSRFPLVRAQSLGRVVVEVGGRELTDENWASARAKEMFFLLLANRSGIRKDEAVEHLYPELPREKCNSAFHSNLYRVRRALYQSSVVKGDDGIYRLNPDGEFEWDVEQFDAAIERAHRAPEGSKERASCLQEALELYAGPFATAFQSEWAASVRSRVSDDAQESLALLAGYFAGREDFESAALCMERVLKANRFNEEAAYQVARYRSRAGQVVQALKFIDQYDASYVHEFGEHPPRRFAELRSAIAAGIAV